MDQPLALLDSVHIDVPAYGGLLTTATLVGCATAYAMEKAEEPAAAVSEPAPTALVAAAPGPSSPVMAQNTEERRPERAIEPRADEILRAMSEHLASAGEFSFHAEVLYDEVVLDGVKVVVPPWGSMIQLKVNHDLQASISLEETKP